MKLCRRKEIYVEFLGIGSSERWSFNLCRVVEVSLEWDFVVVRASVAGTAVATGTGHRVRVVSSFLSFSTAFLPSQLSPEFGVRD